MTDEERARAILGGHFGDADHGLRQNILKHFAAIRADEREKCAQEFEAWGDIYGRNAAEAIRARGSE